MSDKAFSQKSQEVSYKRRMTLGSLIIKAGLAHLDDAVILGSLAEICKKIKTDKNYAHMCREEGKEILEKDKIKMQLEDDIIILQCELKSLTGIGINSKIQNYRSKMELYKYMEKHTDLGGGITTEDVEKFVKKFLPYIGGDGIRSDYLTHMFEFITAKKIHNEFPLDLYREWGQKNKKQDIYDMQFHHNNKTYFVECTTRFSTVIDQYLAKNQQFSSYLLAMNILKKTWENYCAEYCAKNPLGKIDLPWHHERAIKDSGARLSADKKGKIKKLVEEDSFDEAIKSIIDWIHLIREIYYLFNAELIEYTNSAMKPSKNSLLPEERTKELIKIGLPLGQRAHKASPESDKILARFIADSMFSKLNKSYFHIKDQPVILVISLALLPNANDYLNDSGLINRVIKILPDVLQEKYQEMKLKEEDEEQYEENIKLATTNLYAVLINWSTADWFTDNNDQTEVIYNVKSNDDTFKGGLLDSIVQGKISKFDFSLCMFS